MTNSILFLKNFVKVNCIFRHVNIVLLLRNMYVIPWQIKWHQTLMLMKRMWWLDVGNSKSQIHWHHKLFCLTQDNFYRCLRNQPAAGYNSIHCLKYLFSCEGWVQNINEAKSLSGTMIMSSAAVDECLQINKHGSFDRKGDI